MGTLGIVLLVVLAILVVAIVVLYILGKKMQKKQDESQQQMEAAAQSMTFFIIDMKTMKFQDANLPKIVMEQTPKYARRMKVPILKVKVGPRVMSLICDPKVFNTLAPKQEVKASVSGIYVTSAKRIRGPIVETDPKKRKAQLKEEKKAAKEKEKAKAREEKAAKKK
ncbi:MAG: hypothetical protein IIX45_06310 [Lachnospiraceae bacterium]|nr:hypothetical protein [Lachnospiraceae bacterium]